MNRYLDKEGLKKVFEIVNEKDSKLESDVTQVLNGMAQSLNDKADKDSVPTIWKGTQSEYDALGTYDNNTLYLIKE